MLCYTGNTWRVSLSESLEYSESIKRNQIKKVALGELPPAGDECSGGVVASGRTEWQM